MTRQPHEILKKIFGYDSFRKGQLEIIEAIASGRDAIGIPDICRYFIKKAL
ncbi:MAG: hypothetical protein Q4D58_09685 [Synergistaceae bacterium]|nr:hypothetical protein [Synergistaceae bacterium]